MRHLVIGQRQKDSNFYNFSAFHWSPHGCLITIGQRFVTTRVVHLPKRTETSLITESDQSRANHQLLQLCTVRTAWSDSDQAVRAVHSCKSWFCLITLQGHCRTIYDYFFRPGTAFTCPSYAGGVQPVHSSFLVCLPLGNLNQEMCCSLSKLISSWLRLHWLALSLRENQVWHYLRQILFPTSIKLPYIKPL